MQVSVDNDICEGHGQCNAVDAAIFTLDDDGYSNIGSDKPVDPSEEPRARRGVNRCPVRALSIR